MKLNSIVVKPEEVVRRGQKLGIVGNTGFSCGAHLHFALQYIGNSGVEQSSEYCSDVTGGLPSKFWTTFTPYEDSKAWRMQIFVRLKQNQNYPTYPLLEKKFAIYPKLKLYYPAPLMHYTLAYELYRGPNLVKPGKCRQ